MDRYVPSDGLVRSITDDLSDVRDLVASNLSKRSQVVIGNGNLKIVDADSFLLDDDHDSGSTFIIKIKDIPAIRFNDGSIFAPESTANVSDCFTIDTGVTYSVCIVKTEISSIDGTYMPGTPYPVPDEGKHTLLTVGIDIEVPPQSSVETSQSLLVIYNITRDGNNLVIVDDFRESLGIRVPVSGVHIYPDTPSEMFLSTVYGQEYSFGSTGSSGTLDPFLDTDSSMHRETMLRVEWNKSANAWMYEVKIIPYINGTLNPDYAIVKIKVDDGLSIQSVLVPYVNAQIVSVVITPMSHSIFRDRGDPIQIDSFMTGSDKNLETMPIMSMSSTVRQTIPQSVTFSVSSYPSVPNMSMKLILSGEDEDIEIFRGNVGNVTVNIPIGAWTPKVIGIMASGAQTVPLSGSEIVITGHSNDSNSVEMLQTIPISIMAAGSASASEDYAVGYFYGPTGGAALNRVIFSSVGSYSGLKGNDLDLLFRLSDNEDELGIGTSTILSIEEDDEFEWPVVADALTPPLQYNLMFDSGAMYQYIESEKLYRVEINLTADASQSLNLIGTLLLSMAPLEAVNV